MKISTSKKMITLEKAKETARKEVYRFVEQIYPAYIALNWTWTGYDGRSYVPSVNELAEALDEKISHLEEDTTMIKSGGMMIRHKKVGNDREIEFSFIYSMIIM